MIRALLNSLWLLIFATLVSCTSFTFVAKEGPPSTISSNIASEKKQVVSNRVYDFLLWGNIPLNHNIDISKELSRSYINRVGNISIETYQTPVDQLVTYLSLGLFYRHRVKVEGWGDMIEYK